jgi:hypothetical protein
VTFLAPHMLWFGLVLLPLAAIYLLKVRPIRKRTSTWFLWDAVLDENRASALLRRLRDILSLLIMALAVIAAVLAMARPVRKTDTDRRHLLILLDTSLSMRARSGGTTRLALAQRAAQRLVRAMSQERQAAIATVADDVRYVVHLTRNQRQLLRGIDRIALEDVALNPEALRRLRGGSDLAEQARVILVTDGSHNLGKEFDDIERIVVGDEAGNIGVTAFDVVRLPSQDLALGLYFRCASTFDAPRDVELHLSQGSRDHVVRVYQATVTPGLNPGETYTVPGGEPGAWFLECKVDDALARDNMAYAAVPPHTPIRVQVASSGAETAFLRACVRAFGDDHVALQLVRDRPDVLLCRGQGALPDSAGDVIAFMPTVASGLCLDVGDTLPSQTVRAPRVPDPVLRFVDMEALKFKGARRLTLPPGAVPVAQNGAGDPLIYRLSDPKRTAFVFNMDPLESDFVFSAYFPMLVYAMARNLAGRSLNYRASYRPGALLPSPDPDEGRRLTRLGIHTNAVAGQPLVACSLNGETETLINAPPGDRTEATVESGWSVGYGLLAGALMLAACECMLYHRRKVG